MRSDRVTEQREDGKCEGKKSTETVARKGDGKSRSAPHRLEDVPQLPPVSQISF